jgi:hypothetical protein
MIIFTFYLTPCVPLSFKGEGEGFLERGFASLGLSLYYLFTLSLKGGGRE